ncbi:MAG: TIGR00730 family Rossman fold protein [Coprobacter sp.]|nr:TIGR00730 family Rossman fold protein [Coprobacter sp.]
MLNNIGVFCSAGNTIDRKYFHEAATLGNWIGKSGRTLIYGGSCSGLMEETALHVQEHGGKIVGVIPQKICDAGKKSSLPNRQIIVNDLHERKQKMLELGDIFIALPGGFGTLDEVFTIIAAGRLGYHRKKVIFCNTANFYSDLLRQFDVFYTQRFASKKHLNYRIADNIEDCISVIENLEPKP